MSGVRAALRAVVCVLLASTSAHAQARGGTPVPAPVPAPAVARRPVAVVNLDLTGDPAPARLATDIVRVLDAHPQLRGAPDPGAVAALYEPIDDVDAPLLARASADREKASTELANFNYVAAIQHAQDGARELLSVTPSLATRPYAELAFVRGKALVESRNPDAARLAFAHAQRLDPTRILDAARETPDVVAAYNTALAAGAPTGTLQVKGEGHVWIDGTEVGIAPASFTVTVGTHAVWLTGVDRETRGVEIAVAAGAPSVAEIPIAIASARTQVQRARQSLSRAPDSSARSASMKRLASLVGVRDAVLLSSASGKVVVQSWRAGDVENPGFSNLVERGTRAPGELLEILAPPPPAPEEPPVTFPIPIEDPRWYQSTSAKVTLGITGVAVVGVGIYLLSTWLRPSSVMFEDGDNLGFGDGTVAR